MRVGAVRCGRGVVVPVDGGRGQGDLEESGEGDDKEAVSVQDQLSVWLHSWMRDICDIRELHCDITDSVRCCLLNVELERVARWEG